MALERLPTAERLVLFFLNSLVMTSGGRKSTLRLVNGKHPCEGRVEILFNRTWGTVCSLGWDLQDATVVCKQLGCGSAIEALHWAPFGAGSGPIWLNFVNCHGKELTLSNCKHRGWGNNNCHHNDDAGVSCQAFVELVGGDGPCVGRIQINSITEKRSVCDWNFTLSTANVICTELKCGTAVSIVKGTHFGRGNGHIWDKEFQCNGNESFLSRCPTALLPYGKCSHNMDVGVICSKYTDFRLMNGSSQCEGRVEIQVFGTWKTLCDSHWDLADANVLCHQLNCGTAMKPPEDVHFGEGNVEVIGDTFYCAGTESHLWNCSMILLGTSPCFKGKVASVVCSGNKAQSLTPSDQKKEAVLFPENGQLRLLNGSSPCSGRVEIYYNGTWGTICDNSWDMRDAHVVCRQLGCGVAIQTMVSAHFGQGSGPIWLNELSCSGNESHLGECPSLHWGQHNCRHKEDAGVLCSESLDLRLVSNEYKCSGWLEVFYNGTWGSVCSNLMDRDTVSVICRHLRCGVTGQIDPLPTRQENLQVWWIDQINCRGHESSFWHCPSQSWHQNSCHQGEEVYITCAGKKAIDCPISNHCTDKDKLQLRGGKTPCSGRVEIWHNGSWGTICDYSWDLADANVVCHQLGCGSALDALRGSAFGPGNGTIWLNKVQCRGKESSLWDCPAQPWGQNDCIHKQDAGVRCSAERTTLASITEGPITKIVPGLFSLPGILCLILGALLFLVLIFLGTQLHKARAQQQELSRDGNSAYEAVYQEIDLQLTGDNKDLLNSPGSLLSDVGDKLPYYMGENEEESQPSVFPGNGKDILSYSHDTPGDGYDDVKELSGSEIPSLNEMKDRGTMGPINEQNEYRKFHTGQSPKFVGGSADSQLGEEDLPLSPDDFLYDEAEIGIPKMSL